MVPHPLRPKGWTGHRDTPLAPQGCLRDGPAYSWECGALSTPMLPLSGAINSHPGLQWLGDLQHLLTS